MRTETRMSTVASDLKVPAEVKLPIYMDNHATTPVDPRVLEAMLPYFTTKFGNAASRNHCFGWEAEKAVNEAREQIAQLIGATAKEIIFTSGATESDNLAIKGVAEMYRERGNHIITQTTEHKAVLDTCKRLEKHGFRVTYLPVKDDGVIDLEDLKRAMDDQTILVSIMAANNEIGTLQPVSELGAVCRERGIVFHTDAVQWFGKEPFENIHQFNADLVSVCAHKFHGPKGAGLLYIKSPLHPDPIFFGGGHENERRAGTENLPAIIGLVKALELFVSTPVFSQTKIKPLADKLVSAIEKIDGCELVSPRENCLANTVAFVVRGADGIALMAGLDMEGICASSGSACSAGSLEPSHVILAIGKMEEANSLVRFSLGRNSSEAEVDFVCSVLPEFIRRAQLGGLAAKRL